MGRAGTSNFQLGTSKKMDKNFGHVNASTHTYTYLHTAVSYHTAHTTTCIVLLSMQESKLHKIGPLVEGEGERGHVFQLDEMKMEGVGTIVWIFLVFSLLHVVSGSTAYSALCDSVFCSVLSEANAEINKLKGTNMIDCCLHYLLSSSSEVILLPSFHPLHQLTTSLFKVQ